MGVGAMAAILGMDLEKVTAVCRRPPRAKYANPPNINSPEQIVISGHAAAVERATKLARRTRRKTRDHVAGQRALPLFADEAGPGSA